MNYNFASRLDKLGTRKKALDSRLVTYFRIDQNTNATQTRSISASISEPNRMDLFPNGAVTTVEMRDYVVDTDELILNNRLTLPLQGDRIVDQDGTFEVNAQGEMPVFKYTTQSRKRIRIHTKQVFPDVCSP